MTEVLLHYVAHGAEIIRLDAIAYLWKEIGTPCIHLPQTHAVVKLWRAVLDAVAPQVLLITETNVPHADNISYFGQPLPETGYTDEAQLVYNFSLAPLTLHAFLHGDASKLSAWAASLQPTAGPAFFNFIASHDGIGVLPARGILSDDELQQLVERTLAHGGGVSVRSLPDGSQTALRAEHHPLRLPQPARPARSRHRRRPLPGLAGHPAGAGRRAGHLRPQPLRLAQLPALPGRDRPRPLAQPPEVDAERAAQPAGR